MSKNRYLKQAVTEIAFATNKIAFISGPRQCGKTTFAKHLLAERKVGEYYNWDELQFRKLWAAHPEKIIPTKITPRVTPLIILDEIHKAKLWKRQLKGIYDTLKNTCDILVTGSVRLNTYRKGSDSLIGRYYHFRLHPFSLAELLKKKPPDEPNDILESLFSDDSMKLQSHPLILNDLDTFGPFPEPLFQKNKKILRLWQRGRIEKLIREDLRDLSKTLELSQIEMLVSLLPERASNLLSIQSLSEDLEVAYTTMKHWLEYLKALYYCYTIKPYTKSLARATTKAVKLYLWDWSEIQNEALRFENLIASHLLKFCHYLTDTGVGNFELRYLRDKSKKEIDFIILRDNQPWLPIEVKLNETTPSSNWKYFLPKISCRHAIQIVKTENFQKKLTTEFGEILIISADRFLSLLS